MENPFESGHIKNYILLYASVVAIMILFFLATMLFHEDEKIEKKVFNTVIKNTKIIKDIKKDKNVTTRFKLIDINY
ncbi:MAG: hypothetical protein QM497_09015 [Sulfurimonas sp.]